MEYDTWYREKICALLDTFQFLWDSFTYFFKQIHSFIFLYLSAVWAPYILIILFDMGKLVSYPEKGAVAALKQTYIHHRHQSRSLGKP